MFAFWSLVAGAAAGCHCKMPLQGGCVRVLFALCSLVAGAAAGCYCKVLLSKCCLHFGAWLLAPLQGAAVRVLLSVLWSLVSSAAAAGCCWRVLLSGCRCVRFSAWLLVLQGAAAGCCCECFVRFEAWSLESAVEGCWCRCTARCSCYSAVCALELGWWCRCGAAVRMSLLVPLPGSRCRGPGAAATRCCNTLLQGAAIRVAAGCCCESAVCALELGCRCPCCRVRVPLQGAGVGVLCALEKTFKCFPRTPFASSCYLGSMLAQF